MGKKQQLFKLFESESEDDCSQSETNKIPVADKHKPVKRHELNTFAVRQVLTGWLLQQHKPTGLGVNVPTRISRYLADIAAFWSAPVNKTLMPYQTMIIEIRHDREACWPDCADKDKLLDILREAKALKAEFEEQIKRDEPELADDNVLFEEYCGWNYHDSKNSSYHNSCRKVEKIEHAIYKGSRFEMIRTGQVADLLYLAVPENSVSPTEVADGWGLLYFDKHKRVTEIKAPDNWNCSTKERQHLIQNIAAVNSKDMLFRNGINQTHADNSIKFSKAPHRRRSFW